MSDITLFRLAGGKASELQSDVSGLEKPLQTLIEANLESLLGIHFLATEYSTGKVHGGRIDSLGLDENACPVIIEYKRSIGENVISQGLYYLDWLMDHKAEFEQLVAKKMGAKAAEDIDWSAPHLVCIAADFTKYDAHAVQQIDRNIELIRYRLFGDELLLLELVNATSSSKVKSVAKPKQQVDTQPASQTRQGTDKPYTEWRAELSSELVELLTSTEDYILSLGDDVQRKELKLYAAFKRLKNFACVVLQKKRILLYLRLNPDQVTLPVNGKDVRTTGHWGTGDVELSISSSHELDASKALIQMAYEGKTSL